jgi:hypothetical protein
MIAKPVAAAYSSPSPDDQQGLAQLAVLPAQLHQGLAEATDQQRAAVRDSVPNGVSPAHGLARP